MENYFFLENYIISEEAVSHNVLYYQPLPIARYQWRFMLTLSARRPFFEILHERPTVLSKSHLVGSNPWRHVHGTWGKLCTCESLCVGAHRTAYMKNDQNPVSNACIFWGIFWSLFYCHLCLQKNNGETTSCWAHSVFTLLIRNFHFGKMGENSACKLFVQLKFVFLTHL